ncbi:MAG: hypothetical protein QMC46_06665, partial [Burkholderiaceae bacterium]
MTIFKAISPSFFHRAHLDVSPLLCLGRKGLAGLRQGLVLHRGLHQVLIQMPTCLLNRLHTLG